ncbi:MAG: hypothetical protein KJ042_05680 [Deltaproteobacteria bacterium]|nr:hypothetical protein [Deltaproteobacteria bacterium]
MNGAIIINEERQIEALRRAAAPQASRPKPQAFTCAMHDLPYLDGRNGCERCLKLFEPQGNATSWKRGQNIPRANGYTHEERAMLRDFSMSDAEISRKTGRSLVAIAEKRKRMRRQTGDAHDAVLQRAWDAIRRHGGER